MSNSKETNLSHFENGMYEMIQHPVDNRAWAIKILKGDFKGITYAYGKLQIKEDDSKKFATMVFEVDIIDVPDYIKEKEIPKEMQEKFNQFAYEVLCYELKTYFEEKERYDKMIQSGIEPIKSEFDLDE